MRRLRYWLIRLLAGQDIIIGNADSDMWTEGRSLVTDARLYTFGSTLRGGHFAYFNNKPKEA